MRRISGLWHRTSAQPSALEQKTDRLTDQLDKAEGRVTHTGIERARERIVSAEAAALAGTAAAILLSLSAYLLARQPGVLSSSTDRQWYTDATNRTWVLVGLNLAPLGVVAFLWFVAVIRRRLGVREDQFFATVFFGSALVFAVLAIAAAVAASAPTLVVRFGSEPTPPNSIVTLSHALWFGLWGVGGSRLAGVFMVAASTVGRRFGAFPRWLSGFGGLAGALLGVTGAFVGPLDFLFPLWLIVVSITLWIKGRARAESTA
jgi:hypothetical protein